MINFDSQDQKKLWTINLGCPAEHVGEQPEVGPHQAQPRARPPGPPRGFRQGPGNQAQL